MSKPDTIGLGEYTNRDLLQELVNRGVIKKIIGEEDYSRHIGSEAAYDVTVREELRFDQEQRVKELLA